MNLSGAGTSTTLTPSVQNGDGNLWYLSPTPDNAEFRYRYRTRNTIDHSILCAFKKLNRNNIGNSFLVQKWELFVITVHVKDLEIYVLKVRSAHFARSAWIIGHVRLLSVSEGPQQLAAWHKLVSYLQALSEQLIALQLSNQWDMKIFVVIGYANNSFKSKVWCLKTAGARYSIWNGSYFIKLGQRCRLSRKTVISLI